MAAQAWSLHRQFFNESDRQAMNTSEERCYVPLRASSCLVASRIFQTQKGELEVSMLGSVAGETESHVLMGADHTRR